MAEEINNEPKWSLVRKILVPVGLGFKDKVLDQVLSRLMVSTLSVLLFFEFLTIPRSYGNIFEMISKISAFLTISLLLYSFKLLKKRIEKFYGMFDEVLAFHTRISVKKNSINTHFIIFIVCSSLCYVSSLCLILFSKELKSLLQPIITGISFEWHYPYTGLFFITWVFIPQYIIFELCNEYYNVLEFSNKFIERYLKYEPNFEIKYEVMEVIKKFEKNETDFKLIVYPMRRHIIMYNLFINFASFALLGYLLHINPYNFNTISSLLLFILFLDFYLIYTQTVIYCKSKVQWKLLTSINTWINTDDQEFVGKIFTN